MELVLLSLKRSPLIAGLVLVLGCAGAQTPPAAPPSEPPLATQSSQPPAPTEATPVEPAADDPAAASPDEAAKSAAAASEPEPEPAAPPPLPKGTTVLHVGDSMAGALGVELDKALEARGLKAHLRFKKSTFIPTWAWGQELPQYLAQMKPDLVLITLGTNELAMTEPEKRAKTVQRLVKRLEGIPCVWIAPPLYKEDNGLPAVIAENVGHCRWMDTNALWPDMPKLKDKVHPTYNARKKWAQMVLDWLARERDPSGEKPWSLKPAP